MLSREYRIRKQAEFDKIYRQSKRFRSDGLTILVHFNNSRESVTKFGIVVSKKIGNAVVRNKLKRQFRAIFRESILSLKSGLEIVVVAYPGIEKLSFAEINRVIENTLKAIN